MRTKLFVILTCLLLVAVSARAEYLGDFVIGDTVYFPAAFNDTTGTQYEATASVAGRLYRGGTYVAAPAWAELDDANLVGVWQASQDTSGYTAGQYTMVVWGTIDASKVPQKTITFNLYAATGKPVDAKAISASTTAADNVQANIGNLDEAISGIDDNPWDAGTRSLTDKAGFTISGTTTTLDALSTHGDSTWATATGFSTHAAADIWSVVTRALTDKAGFGLAADAIGAGQIADNAFSEEHFDDDIDGFNLYESLRIIQSKSGGKRTRTVDGSYWDIFYYALDDLTGAGTPVIEQQDVDSDGQVTGTITLTP